MSARSWKSPASPRPRRAPPGREDAKWTHPTPRGRHSGNPENPRGEPGAHREGLLVDRAVRHVVAVDRHMRRRTKDPSSGLLRLVGYPSAKVIVTFPDKRDQEGRCSPAASLVGSTRAMYGRRSMEERAR